MAKGILLMQRKLGSLPCAPMLRKLPNGPWSALAVFIVLLAWLLSISSTGVCSYAQRNSSIRTGNNGTNISNIGDVFFKDHGVGFWGWESSGSCLSFKIRNQDPSFDSAYKAATAFTILSNLFGGIIMVIMWLGMCFPITRAHFKKLGIALILVSIFSLIPVIAFLNSNICSPGFYEYILGERKSDFEPFKDLVSTSCKVGNGANLSIAAFFFYLLTGIVCIVAPLDNSSAHRSPENTYPSFRVEERFDDEDDDHTNDDDDESDEGEGKVLHDQRKEETERRYREMFGDEGDEGDEGDDDDDNAAMPFKTLREPALGKVDEDENTKSSKSNDRNTSVNSRNENDEESQSQDDRSFFTGNKTATSASHQSNDQSRSNYDHEESGTYSSEDASTGRDSRRTGDLSSVLS